MRRDPRTGEMMLEPGDPGYTPYSSDGGYFAYNMGLGPDFQGFDPGQAQVGGGLMAQYQEPPQPQDGFEFQQPSLSEIQVNDADLMQGMPGSVGGDFVAQDPYRQGYEAQQRVLRNRAAIRRGETPDVAIGREVAGVPVDENFIGRLQEVAGQQRAAQPGSITGEDLAARAPIEGQGPQPISLEGTPTASPVVGETESRSLAATPERQAEGTEFKDPRKAALQRQMAIAGGLGAIQATIPILQRTGLTDPAMREALRVRDEYAAGEAGQAAYEETMGAGRAAINRQAQLSRQVQEDIAAASGVTDVRRQEQIRQAAADAFTKEEAELEAEAREIAARTESQNLADFRSAIAYISQSNNAVMQGVSNALTSFAPVLAAIDVNEGYKVYSKDIQNLPQEFQDMFYALSLNAKNNDELARIHAYVNKRAAAAQTAQASATQNTDQNTQG